MLLVKLKWWQILSLYWLPCATSKEKINLWVTCDHLIFKGCNLKWRNTRNMFYNVIVLDHMFYETKYMCCIKSRHVLLESNFSLWCSTSADHRLDKIQMFYDQLLHFCKNCIACASRWILACVLVFPLAVMTTVLFTCLFCSKEKIVANWYTYQSTIL